VAHGSKKERRTKRRRTLVLLFATVRRRFMALVSSTMMMPLGSRAPDFALMETSGQRVSLADLKVSKGLLVVFMCNHCPYVKHVADQLRLIGEEYIPQGIAMVGINPNDATQYPEDSFDKMIEEKKARRYPFPYLYDEEQKVARAYDAACTPDFFLFGRDLKLVYRGRLDETRPSSATLAHGRDLRAALSAVLQERELPGEQIPSMGCSIKWR
jgi:peroxiredoxin